MWCLYVEHRGLWCQGLTGNHVSSSHPTNCKLFEMVRGETDNYTDTSWNGS